MFMFMRWVAMACIARPSGSRRFAARPATPRSLPGTTPHCITLKHIPISSPRYSLALCHRLSLERHASLMWEECHVAGKSVKGPAEALGWNLARGRGGLSGLPTDEKQPEGGLGMAARIIHHVQ